MARNQKRPVVKARPRRAGSLVSVDGVNAGAIVRRARRLATADGRTRAGISWWDASGIFGDLDASATEVDRPSARTLLLLYAADLAFRIRWEIRPALAEGRTVIAAPYVDTAIAFGRAEGVEEAWLRATFSFALASAEKVHIKDAPSLSTSSAGFMEFVCRWLVGVETRSARQDLATRTHARLKATR